MLYRIYTHAKLVSVSEKKINSFIKKKTFLPSFPFLTEWTWEKNEKLCVCVSVMYGWDCMWVSVSAGGQQAIVMHEDSVDKIYSYALTVENEWDEGRKIRIPSMHHISYNVC